jgi:hypothetical protein
MTGRNGWGKCDNSAGSTNRTCLGSLARYHLVAGQATAADEQDVPKVDVVLVDFRGRKAHRDVTVRTNRGADW